MAPLDAPTGIASAARVAQVNSAKQPPSLLRRLSDKAIVTGTFAIVALAVGGGAAVQATTPPDTVAPPDTSPITIAPDTTPITIAPDNGGSGTDWLPILIVVILGIVLISILVALMSRRKPAPAATTPVTPAASPQSEIMSTAQWIHDQLSLELLAAAPAAGLQRWSSERSRLDNVAIRANQQFTEGRGEAWQGLGQSMSQLGAALDTSLQLRNQDPPNAQLIQESSNVVTRRRGELQLLLTAIWPTVQR